MCRVVPKWKAKKNFLGLQFAFLASITFVEPFVVWIELLYIHFLSLLSELWILVQYFFNNWYCISLILWPFLLKWIPVAFVIFWVFTYPLCSENLSLSERLVSPIYCWGHFLHPNKYIKVLVKQLIFFLFAFWIVDPDWTISPELMFAYN